MISFPSCLIYVIIAIYKECYVSSFTKEYPKWNKKVIVAVNIKHFLNQITGNFFK